MSKKSPKWLRKQLPTATWLQERLGSLWDWMFANCSTTAQRGALDWAPKFEKVIKPVIEELNKENNLIFGPFSADSFFVKGNIEKYDTVLAMYHDQGLIPFKTLNFGSGVNFTSGMPFLRTSPDHGTAYDIAGKGIASPISFSKALLLAREIYINRFKKANEKAL